MAYQKQQFQNYTVLTAEQLNYIEDGIINVERSVNTQISQAVDKYMEELNITPDVHVSINEPTDENIHLWVKTASVNLLNSAINKDGTPFIGDNGEVGYGVGFWHSEEDRLEYDGDGMCLTGYIPATPTSKLLFSGVDWWDDMEHNVIVYDSNFQHLGFHYFDNSINGLGYVKDEQGREVAVSIDIGIAFENDAYASDISYVRFYGITLKEGETFIVSTENTDTVLKIKKLDGTWQDVTGAPELDSEEWTFELDDGSTVTKQVVIK